MKKIISFLLIFTLIFGGAVMADASEAETKLYEIYGNGMLFQQKEEAVLSGKGKGGSLIEAELFNSANESVAVGKSSVNRSGAFEVSFTAPKGSYEEYTIVLKADGTEFAKLENVVFGELWLASGQSNMQYPLGQAKHGREMMANGEKQSKWLRVLLVPAYNEYKGSTELLPADPQEDIIDAEWITGENSSVYGMSAVAFFFADKMIEELDMPVGILNASLGGTLIRSWISRNAIDSDSKVKEILVNKGCYIDKADWKESGGNVYADMTVNYNTKIEPLKRFRPAGMIWYQGESEIMSGFTADEYEAQFDLLQSSYSELFGYENELMPVVYSQLASYLYSGDVPGILDFNIGLTQMQNETRASISVYDVPLTFIPEAGSIHPENKLEFGERMADAALRLVYGEENNCIVSTVKSSEVKDSSVYVTFDNVGDGLAANGDKPDGFAVCGSDGIYVKANAEIVSEDTVRIWSDEVKNPAAATYAYSILNLNANVYSTSNGKLLFPVCQFETEKIANAHYWCEKPWVDCEQAETFHTHNDEDTGFFASWKSENATIAYSKEKYIDISGNGEFTVSPVMNFVEDGKAEKFKDTDYDYSDYGKLTFVARNNGNKDVKLDMVKIYVNHQKWYSPKISGTNYSDTVIPADGEWHRITVDLDSLLLKGNECGFTYSRNKLKNVYEISLCFTSDEGAQISLDEFRFTPSSEKTVIRCEANIKDADNLLEMISAMFVSIIGVIIGIF